MSSVKKDNSLWKEEFAKRLRESLDQSHLSATDLSNATGIGKSDISNYTQGKYLPRQDRVFLMAKALGVDPVWLYALDVKYTLEAQSNIATPEEAMAYLLSDESALQHHYHPTVSGFITANGSDDYVRQMLSGMERLSEDDQKKLLDMARVMFPDAFPD